jgi:hypothetical protein
MKWVLCYLQLQLNQLDNTSTTKYLFMCHEALDCLMFHEEEKYQLLKDV